MADSLFGIHAQALMYGRQRMDLLASNLANADTPHFQAKDLDFKAALAAAAGTGGTTTLATTQTGHIPVAGNAANGGAQEVWRVPTQPSADGNTVETQIEQGQFAESALRYQASLNFLDSRVRSLMTAITGQ